MRPLRRRLAMLLLGAACVAGSATAQDRLPAAVRAALAEAGLPADALGAVALPIGHGGRPWRHRATESMAPASTMKVLTSAVALDRLTPSHRGFTELRSAALLQGDVLQGDLVLKGGADTDLGVAEFWELLARLRASGVRTIAGDLLLDRSLFRPARFDIGLPPFDDAPEFPYNVIPDALHLAGSLLPLRLSSAGGVAAATTAHGLGGIEIVSRMTLIDRPCREWAREWQPARVSETGTGQPTGLTIELSGSFPRQGSAPDGSCEVQAELQLIERNRLAEALFRTLWRTLGGQFAGRVREGVAPADSRLLLRRESRPLGELVRNINKESDNPQTRLAYLSLGLKAMAQDSSTPTAELAAREVRAWLAEQGIDSTGLVLDNGSGLSRSERITPQMLAQVLQAAWRSRYASELMMSLPMVGSETARRLRGTPAAEGSRMKGGLLRDVLSLAGYVRDTEGRPWAVVAILNHPQATRHAALLHAVVDAAARGLLFDRAAMVGPVGEGP